MPVFRQWLPWRAVPDRADALVWALSDLMLAAPPAAPARWVPTRFNMGR
ncbi:hypothetical protein RAA17_14275 [Komagataeibacter rhaeticus]|nr:hypothetical protein [Komagataeibacter rhaeticus]